MKKLEKLPTKGLLNKTPIKRAISASNYKTQIDNSKWQANPLLKTSVPKQTLQKMPKLPAKGMPMEVKKIVPTMKQYGDKGYKPSNGKGVGY